MQSFHCRPLKKQPFLFWLCGKRGNLLLKLISSSCLYLPKDYASVNAIFDIVLSHEIKVSNEINALVELCILEKDYTTHNFLQWYVTEQIEEETLARNVIDKLKLIGEDKGGMYLFDRDLGTMAVEGHGK